MLDFRPKILDRPQMNLGKTQVHLKPFLFFLPIMMILSSCSRQNEVYFILEDSSGLKDESAVLINGYQIAEVQKLELLKNHKTFVTIRLIEDTDIPEDSEFTVTKSNLLGDAVINVTIGKSKTYISAADTLQGRSDQKPTEIEAAIIRVAKNVAYITDSLKTIRDSNNTQHP